MENSPVLFPEIASKRPTTLSKEGWEKVIIMLPEHGLKLDEYTDEQLADTILLLQKQDWIDQEDIYNVLYCDIISANICFDEDDDEEFGGTSRYRGFFESWHQEAVEFFYRKEVSEWAEGEIQRDPEFFKPIKIDTCLRNPYYYIDVNLRTKIHYYGVAFVGNDVHLSMYCADIVSAEGYRIGYIGFEERFEEVEELRFELRKAISHPKVKETYEVGTVKTHREWIELLKLKSEDLVLPFFKPTNTETNV